MAGYRFLLQCSLAVALSLSLLGAGSAQFRPIPQGTTAGGGIVEVTTSGIEKAQPTCKVYSLAEMGDDPKLCKWIADTIPEVIQPASWKQDGVKITYYAPGKVMVITHSAAVHAQVDSFLQDMRKSMPQAKTMASGVVPAQFAVPDNRPLPAAQAYPVPYPPSAPKHLFHFIIRYEGDGVIDSNVVKFTKALSQETARSNPPVTAYQPATPVTGWTASPPASPPSLSNTMPTLPIAEPAPRPLMPPADPVAPPPPSLPPGVLPRVPTLGPVPF